MYNGDMQMKSLIIIPAYNEERNIKNVVAGIRKTYPDYDYLVVNDGSKDNTARICEENGYNYLNLAINLGLSGAFQAGVKYAYYNGYDAVLQVDGDGQHQAAVHVARQRAQRVNGQQRGDHRGEAAQLGAARRGEGDDIFVQDRAEHIRARHARQRAEQNAGGHQHEPRPIGPEIRKNARNCLFGVFGFSHRHTRSRSRHQASAPFIWEV